SLWAHLCFLPSARGAADAQNAPPIPCHDAVPCACEAVACEHPFCDASRATCYAYVCVASAVTPTRSCRVPRPQRKICNTTTHFMAFLQFLYRTFMTSQPRCVILRGSRSRASPWSRLTSDGGTVSRFSVPEGRACHDARALRGRFGPMATRVDLRHPARH